MAVLADYRVIRDSASERIEIDAEISFSFGLPSNVVFGTSSQKPIMAFRYDKR